MVEPRVRRQRLRARLRRRRRAGPPLGVPPSAAEREKTSRRICARTSFAPHAGDEPTRERRAAVGERRFRIERVRRRVRTRDVREWAKRPRRTARGDATNDPRRRAEIVHARRARRETPSVLRAHRVRHHAHPSRRGVGRFRRAQHLRPTRDGARIRSGETRSDVRRIGRAGGVGVGGENPSTRSSNPRGRVRLRLFEPFDARACRSNTPAASSVAAGPRGGSVHLVATPRRSCCATSAPPATQRRARAVGRSPLVPPRRAREQSANRAERSPAADAVARTAAANSRRRRSVGAAEIVRSASPTARAGHVSRVPLSVGDGPCRRRRRRVLGRVLDLVGRRRRRARSRRRRRGRPRPPRRGPARGERGGVDDLLDASPRYPSTMWSRSPRRVWKPSPSTASTLPANHFANARTCRISLEARLAAASSNPAETRQRANAGLDLRHGGRSPQRARAGRHGAASIAAAPHRGTAPASAEPREAARACFGRPPPPLHGRRRASARGTRRRRSFSRVVRRDISSSSADIASYSSAPSSARAITATSGGPSPSSTTGAAAAAATAARFVWATKRGGRARRRVRLVVAMGVVGSARAGRRMLVGRVEGGGAHDPSVGSRRAHRAPRRLWPRCGEVRVRGHRRAPRR